MSLMKQHLHEQNEMNVQCYVDEDPVNCTTWETETVDTKLKERRQLCKDLEDAVLEEKRLLEHIIDDYVYRLTDNEVRGYAREVNKILGTD